MAEAITVNSYRRRLASTMAGGATAKKIAFMAFGDGGHNANLTAKAPDPEQTSLNNELMRKPLTAVVQEDDFSVTGRGMLDYDELVGYAISEAALLNEDGDLVGVKNFAPKVKESDERYETSVKLRF
ncbi:phage tail-collar fiber domain-containing protein [Vreelandella aquamarina]|uniref:phage tail-collar fiber domain-containing protein n=1 Tax=Vreelandella aquamarina TaxID=77097 RepID=UPI0007832899|nr:MULTISPECIES: phage tail protein [Halomonas]MDK2751207.1 phage tail protein [Halomonas meridiana]